MRPTQLFSGPKGYLFFPEQNNKLTYMDDKKRNRRGLTSGQGKIQRRIGIRPQEDQTKYHGEVVHPHLVVRRADSLEVLAQQPRGVPLYLAQLFCTPQPAITQTYT
jgi:hypothetical protein